jgi:hypothetical protein
VQGSKPTVPPEPPAAPDPFTGPDSWNGDPPLRTIHAPERKSPTRSNRPISLRAFPTIVVPVAV